MTVSLVLPEPIARQLATAVQADVESAGVLLARVATTPQGNMRLLAREMHWVPKRDYIVRDANSLSVTSPGYVPALAAAESDNAVPIWLHTHPGTTSTPQPSKADKIVDRELTDLFRLRSGSPFYGALVIANGSQDFSFSGHIENDCMRSKIDRIWTTGRRFRLEINWFHKSPLLSDRFDRNIRAFGGNIQEVLGNLVVAVVGCGGTGSAVIEQLVRLGVKNFILFDPDELTKSNLTRVYGSFPQDVGKSKVEICASHIRRINSEADVAANECKITQESAAKSLTDADVIFGCTDDNAGRLALSRFATYFMTPVIDCGVLLSSDDAGDLTGIDGRITVLAPGVACLICRGRIDLQRAAAEVLPVDVYERLANEGYAPALPGVEPAVVAYTTQIAAAAVAELLERLVRYGPEPVPTEVLLRMHEREVSTNDRSPRPGHYCDCHAGKLGLGFTDPFLEQTWQY